MPARRRQVVYTSVWIAVLMLAFLLRAQGLNAQGLWYDEGSSVVLAGKGLREILLGKFDHPPLYHLLLAVWIRLVGNGEFAARFLSVCCGTLVVALGGALAALLLGTRAGALTALFLAVSPIEVWYAQEARMYALLGALTLASSICLLRLLQGERRRRLWILYTAANVAAVYTHYYAALAMAAQAAWVLWHWLRGRDWRFVRSWALAQVGLGLALVPWLPVVLMYWRSANATYWPGQLSWQYILAQTALGFAGAGLTVPAPTAQALILYASALAGFGVLSVLWRREWRWGALLLVSQLLIPFAVFCAFVHDRPKFSPRYLLVIVPALEALAAGGVAALWPQALRSWRAIARVGLAGIVGAGLALGSAYAATNGQRDRSLGRDDLRGAAKYLTGKVADDEAVILLSGHFAPAFAYYYHRQDCYPIPPKATPVPSVDDILSLDVIDDLNRAIQGRQGVWILLWQDEVVDPNHVVLSILDSFARQVPVKKSFRGLDLRHYVFPAGTVLQREMFGRQPLKVTTADGDIEIVSCDLPSRPVPSGQDVSVLLYSQALRPTSRDYRISFRLIDDRGQELATRDDRLASYIFPTNRWQPGQLIMVHHDVHLPAGLPPGEYSLQAHVYPYGAQSDQVLRLGRLQVGRASQPPDLAQLGIARPLGLALGELELLQYSLSPAEAAPGQQAYLTLFWRAGSRPGQRYRIALYLGERRWVELPLPASLTGMEPGDIIRVQYPLTVPPDTPGPRQPLALALEDPAGQQVARPTVLGELAIQGGQRVFQAPGQVGHPRRVTLGDKVVFLGYDLQPDRLSPGGTLHLTLYWQAAQQMATSYTVFVHVLDQQQKIWGQVDSIPVHQSRPTTGWLPGEVLADSYDVPVRPGGPAGAYGIEVGLYDAATGGRLEVREGGVRAPGDRVLLDPVTLGPTPAAP